MVRKATTEEEYTEESKSNIHVSNTHIYFYDEINSKTSLELILIIQELVKENKKVAIEFDLDEPPAIYLHINSEGGSLIDAFAVVDVILDSQVKVISIIEGHAASAATLISVVCHERWIRPNAVMLVHELRSGNWGKFSDIETDMKNLTDMMNRLKEIYIKYTSLSSTDLKRILSKDRYWDAQKCFEYKLVDYVME